MGAIRELNNRISGLLDQGHLDEAERVLAETAALLAARGPAEVDGDDLEPALDEYFFRVHSVDLRWRQARYAEALPHAERAYALEQALVAAARAQGFTRRELDILAFSAGTWGWISVLTKLGRLDEAEQAFEAYVVDEELYWARHRHHARSAEQVLIAGLCLYWEGDERRQQGREILALAERLGAPENPELAYGFACYWALLGEPRPALAALALALRLGIQPRRAREDDDLRSLRGRPEWERLFSRKPAPTPAPAPTPEPPATSPGSADEQAIEERRLMDSRSQPDEAAREKTRTFLGPKIARASILLARHTTYGLGGVHVEVRGDGQVKIAKEAFGPHEKAGTHSLRLEPAAAQGLFMAFIDEAFTEMFLGSAVGVPDELYFELALVNARGKKHALGKFVRTEHARFDALVNRVHEGVAAALDPATRQRLTL
jgi:tetratricopeptide (TPR) repeat protein